MSQKIVLIFSASIYSKNNLPQFVLETLRTKQQSLTNSESLYALHVGFQLSIFYIFCLLAYPRIWNHASSVKRKISNIQTPSYDKIKLSIIELRYNW